MPDGTLIGLPTLLVPSPKGRRSNDVLTKVGEPVGPVGGSSGEGTGPGHDELDW